MVVLFSRLYYTLLDEGFMASSLYKKLIVTWGQPKKYKISLVKNVAALNEIVQQINIFILGQIGFSINPAAFQCNGLYYDAFIRHPCRAVFRLRGSRHIPGYDIFPWQQL